MGVIVFFQNGAHYTNVVRVPIGSERRISSGSVDEPVRSRRACMAGSGAYLGGIGNSSIFLRSKKSSAPPTSMQRWGQGLQPTQELVHEHVTAGLLEVVKKSAEGKTHTFPQGVPR